jgi:ADP-ribose diphosphatase
MAKRMGIRDVLTTGQFAVKEVRFKLDNGKEFDFAILKKPDSAVIVPILPDGRLVLIHEYFPAIDESGLGLPKGKMNPGETPQEAANRELQEEAGFKAGNLLPLSTFTLSPGMLWQRTHAFLATGLTESKLKADEDEEIKVVTVPFKDFPKLIKEGKIQEARTIAALFLARDYLAKGVA